nr:hypothetical protein [Tanacetum cinerariifolium]
MQFIYVLPGWEGSAHDGRVLRDAISREDGLKIPQGCYYLVDAGYCNAPGFLAPFRGEQYHLNEFHGQQPRSAEEYFNMKHSKARNVIERCFGLLKGPWKILVSPSFFPIEVEQAEENEIEDGEPLGDDDYLAHINPKNEMLNKLALTGANMALYRITRHGFIKEDFDGSDVEKEGDNNVSMVPDSVKEDVNVQAEEKGNDFDVNNSLDPFELYPILNKKKNVEDKIDKSNRTVSIPFPPGFTPYDETEVECDKKSICNNEGSGFGNEKGKSVSIGSRKSNKIDIQRTGGSLLIVMEELIK